MTGFAFNDAEWERICSVYPTPAKSSRDKRLPCKGDRFSLEMIATLFIQDRERNGRRAPQPTEARRAWLAVAKAAAQLHEAIQGLASARATDFGVLGQDADDWARALPSIIESSEWIAGLEVYDRKDAAPNTDPSRDWLITAIARHWRDVLGGDIALSTNAQGEVTGPLARFMLEIVGPIFREARMDPLSSQSLRGILRKMNGEPKP